MSGNGTRIAARWLAERTGKDVVTVRVGPRVVIARMLGGDDVEQELGDVRVGAVEVVDGIEVIAVDVGNPHAVVLGDPAVLPALGRRTSRVTSASRIAPTCRLRGWTRRAR